MESYYLFKSRRVAQLVEHRSPKPGVAGSSPASPAFNDD